MIDPIIQVPAAAQVRTATLPTGRMRWFSYPLSSLPHVLQQEWRVTWHNNSGGNNIFEWHDVPTVEWEAK